RAAADVDVDRTTHPAVVGDDGVLHLRTPTPVVGNSVKLAGGRIAQRVRGVRARQRAFEVAGADGVELVSQLVGITAAFDDRERAAGVADHVGVRREVEPGVYGPRARRFSEGARRGGVAHVAVAVPAGASALDADAVH